MLIRPARDLMAELVSENRYCRELAELKPHDPIQKIDLTACNFEFPFITTAGHGYLAVDINSEHSALAVKLCKFGYQGKLATYLEEDCEAPDFINELNGDSKPIHPRSVQGRTQSENI